MDATGTLLWQKIFGGSNRIMHSPWPPPPTGVHCCGWYSSTDGDRYQLPCGDWDYWVVKMDATGNLQWQKTFGGSGDDYSTSIALSTDGGYIVAGCTNSTDGDVANNHGNEDIWVVKLTHDYNTIGGVVFGDLNSNGVLDTDETLVANHRLQLDDGTLPTWSGTNGTYSLNVLEQGTFEVEPDPLQHYVVTPATYSTTFTGFLETDLLGDFALQPEGTVNDLFVSIAPSSPFRPGFDAQYVIYYTNYGTTSLAPTITLYLDDCSLSTLPV